jgi:hypothetical protein
MSRNSWNLAHAHSTYRAITGLEKYRVLLKLTPM